MSTSEEDWLRESEAWGADRFAWDDGEDGPPVDLSNALDDAPASPEDSRD